MKHILFPTDFSEAAQGALHVALSLARKNGGTLHVLHSLDTVQKYLHMSMTSVGDPVVTGLDPKLVTEIIDGQREEANKNLQDLKAKYPEVALEVHVSEGELYEDVNEYCEKLSIDVVVMGTHGASGFREAFIGSNAQKVVRLAKVPVLTVREAPTDFDVEKVVYASDFVEKEVNSQLPRINDFAASWDAKLHLLYVNTPGYFEDTKSTLKRIKTVKREYELGGVRHYIYNDFNIEEGIIAYAKMAEADVIAIVTHGFTGIRKLLNDNITEAVVNHSPIPVLSLHIR